MQQCYKYRANHHKCNIVASSKYANQVCFKSVKEHIVKCNRYIFVYNQHMAFRCPDFKLDACNNTQCYIYVGSLERKSC